MASKSLKPKTGTAARIYSTITNSTEYCEWKPSANDIPQKGFGVIIQGGAGVATKFGLVTPFGAMTEVTSDQLDFLQAHATFQRHVAEGWLLVQKASGWKDDPDAVAANMAQRDGSAPLVPNDYAEAKIPTHGSLLPNMTAPTTKPRSRPVPGMILNAFR